MASARAKPNDLLKQARNFRFDRSLTNEEKTSSVNAAEMDIFVKSNLHPDSSAEKRNKSWILKPINVSPAVAGDPVSSPVTVQTIAGEIMRLFLLFHPKYRGYQDFDGDLGVIAEFVPHDEKPAALADRLAFYKAVAEGKIFGLGGIQVIYLLINEIDLKLHNLILSKNNVLVGIDRDHSLARINRRLKKESRFVTVPDEDTLSALPNLPDDHAVHNWLASRNVGVPLAQIQSTSDATTKLKTEAPKLMEQISESETFRNGINGVNPTLLSLKLVSEELLMQFFRNYTRDEAEITEISKLIFKLREKLNEAAMENVSFQKYMRTKAAEEHLAVFQKHLQNFKTMGKKFLLAQLPSGESAYLQKMQKEFAQVRLTAAMALDEELTIEETAKNLVGEMKEIAEFLAGILNGDAGKNPMLAAWLQSLPATALLLGILCNLVKEGITSSYGKQFSPAYTPDIQWSTASLTEFLDFALQQKPAFPNLVWGHIQELAMECEKQDLEETLPESLPGIFTAWRIYQSQAVPANSPSMTTSKLFQALGADEGKLAVNTSIAETARSTPVPESERERSSVSPASMLPLAAPARTPSPG